MLGFPPGSLLNRPSCPFPNGTATPKSLSVASSSPPTPSPAPHNSNVHVTSTFTNTPPSQCPDDPGR